MTNEVLGEGETRVLASMLGAGSIPVISNKGALMTAPRPQLSVRSAKARRENRSIAEVVERALAFYEVREAGREPAAAFYARLSAQAGTDVDLESVIRENRRPNHGIDL